VEFRLRRHGTSGEGDLLQLMQGSSKRPRHQVFKLPSRGTSEKRHIEFGFKGPRAEAQAACDLFRQHLLVYQRKFGMGRLNRCSWRTGIALSIRRE